VTVILLPGDYDLDADVDGFDFLKWQQQLGSSAAPAGSGADGTGDGAVNAADLTAWSGNFSGSSAAATAAAVQVDPGDISINAGLADAAIVSLAQASVGLGDVSTGSLTPRESWRAASRAMFSLPAHVEKLVPVAAVTRDRNREIDQYFADVEDGRGAAYAICDLAIADNWSSARAQKKASRSETYETRDFRLE
jgi:hypothetical protein